jgi:hypothetical protein
MSGKQLKIAISGKARAGKNSAASFIIKHTVLNENNAKIVALADPMKKIVKMMFPEAKNECLFGPSELRAEVIAKDKYLDKERSPLTYRNALIDLGAFGRKYNNDIWLNCLVEDANISKDKLVYIVADVRYINEFEFLKKSNFYMIRILRDSFTKINDNSETEQDIIPNSDFDRVIYNNGSLEDLSKELKCLRPEGCPLDGNNIAYLR